MIKLEKALFDTVSTEAKNSPRLRMNRDMRNSSEDNSQRMLNALEPGTVFPIHRHPNTSETCIILRGEAEEVFYDDNGNETERVGVQPNSHCVGVNIPAGAWHKIVALKPDTVIFEAKDGAYEPTSSKDILSI